MKSIKRVKFAYLEITHQFPNDTNKNTMKNTLIFSLKNTKLFSTHISQSIYTGLSKYTIRLVLLFFFSALYGSINKDLANKKFHLREKLSFPFSKAKNHP